MFNSFFYFKIYNKKYYFVLFKSFNKLILVLSNDRVTFNLRLILGDLSSHTRHLSTL